MRNNVILLDGAGGTSLWNMAEAKGFARKPVWKYNMEHPELVKRLAEDYIAAGSRIIYANTFGANRPSVERSSPYTVAQVASAGVRIAREAARGTGVRVALDVGPLPMLMEPYGDLTEEEAEAIFREQIDGGMAEQPDLVVLETFLDLEMLKVAVRAAKGRGIPVLCTMSFEAHGRTIMGDRVEDIVAELTGLGVDGVGLNCSLGPAEACPIFRKFAENTDLPLIFKPNAGNPVLGEDGSVISPYSPEDFARDVAPVLDQVTYLGACCGSSPEYIRTLHQMLNR